MPDDVIRDVPTRPPAGLGFLSGRVSWGAIWAGVMVTLGVAALFLSFEVFIDGVLGGSTVWTIIWFLVTMGTSFYAGARTAGRLSGCADRETCILHGMATWGLATLAMTLIGGVLGWAAFVRSGGYFSPTLWAPATQWGGSIWGGVVLSLLGAYYGGANALGARTVTTTERETPGTPLRRVS
ncbi:MAG TPA: hypothetical protein VH640_08795 [Bryobacteraceae bacterium]